MIQPGRTVAQRGLLGRFKRKLTFKEYYKTSHWERLSAKAIRAAQKKDKRLCVYVKGDPLQVHHLRYYDENGNSILFREKLSDLKVMRKSQHRKLHDHKF